jgi:hypothetical protein
MYRDVPDTASHSIQAREETPRTRARVCVNKYRERKGAACS